MAACGTKDTKDAKTDVSANDNGTENADAKTDSDGGDFTFNILVPPEVPSIIIIIYNTF